MVQMILCAGPQRRHGREEQTWTQWKERVGWFERIALKHIHGICKTEKYCEFDVRTRAPKAHALWQPGRIGWGRRWGAGFRMEGTHVYLCVDVYQIPSQDCKVIILQLNELILKIRSGNWNKNSTQKKVLDYTEEPVKSMKSMDWFEQTESCKKLCLH